MQLQYTLVFNEIQQNILSYEARSLALSLLTLKYRIDATRSIVLFFFSSFQNKPRDEIKAITLHKKNQRFVKEGEIG